MIESLDLFEQQTRISFNACIDHLSGQHINKVDWWVSAIAARNTYTCDLYANVIELLFASQRLSNGSKAEIFIRSRLVYKLLLKRFPEAKQQIQLRGSLPLKQRCIAFIKQMLMPGFLMLTQLFFWVAAKRYHKAPQFSEIEPLTLVDMFLFRNSFDENGFYKDRYYGELKTYLSASERSSFYYMPTRQDSIKTAFSLMKCIRSSQDQFVLQEDFLCLRDYFWVFLHPFRALKFYPKSGLMIDGVDVTPLFRRAWWQSFCDGSAMVGLLKYRFVQRLAQRKVPLRLVVDWFENQAIDKGLHLGLKHYYPNIDTLGYQGFIVPDYYLCMNPTTTEHQAGVLPKSVIVCGPGFIKQRQAGCGQIPVEAGPAFRFQNVYAKPVASPIASHWTILVTLHLAVENAMDVLRLVRHVDWSRFNKPVKLLIRPHPTMFNYQECLKAADIKIGGGIALSQGDFAAAIDSADILLGSASSTCLEALAKAKPVVIVGSDDRVTQNPIPNDVSTQFWRLVHTSEDAVEALQQLLLLDQADLQTFSRHIRQQYFSIVDRMACRQFLRMAHMK